ncbi:hypothetical protein [Bifidobacterium olomucense]|uniref:Uncharacterized protein n=1 Tax=Bifidobacterium olomucense TaxID=2675324 RepID=A0A7Y0EX86_9BIFI|nr:hypothetical protein [Bifidobacterium sp. DSM 109959]NMM98090.1 hypothetical protein [Bifidobacterium sp. DSM 109959]
MPDFNRLLDLLRDLFDTVFPDEDSAMRFLGVGRDYFRQYYKPYCGFKQGNSMTFRKSELLERREQLRHEAGGVRG